MERPQVTRLKSGLTVITSRQPYMASAALGIWAGIGGRHESARENGAAHFIEHLLFKGTQRRSALEISEAIEGVGGYHNAFTSEDHTCFHARAHHTRLDILLDVLLDMFVNSRFAPSDIRTEREVIFEEIEQYNDQPAQRVHEVLNSIQWPDQPIGRSLTGTRESLTRLRRPEILRFHHGHYRAGSIVITAAGRVSHRQIVDALSAIEHRFTPGFAPAPVPAVRGDGMRLHREVRRTTQTQLALGFHTTPRRGELRHAIRLLNALLGENMSSRLFQELREERGLAYSIFSSVSFWEDTGDLVISAGVDPSRLSTSLKVIVHELKRLQNEKVSEAELDRARDFILGQFELSQESTENRMLTLGEQWLGWGRTFPPEAVRKGFLQVSPADIQTAARAFLTSNRSALALVTPRRTATESQLAGILQDLDT